MAHSGLWSFPPTTVIRVVRPTMTADLLALDRDLDDRGLGLLPSTGIGGIGCFSEVGGGRSRERLDRRLARRKNAQRAGLTGSLIEPYDPAGLGALRDLDVALVPRAVADGTTVL